MAVIVYPAWYVTVATSFSHSRANLNENAVRRKKQTHTHHINWNEIVKKHSPDFHTAVHGPEHTHTLTKYRRVQNIVTMWWISQIEKMIWAQRQSCCSRNTQSYLVYLLLYVRTNAVHLVKLHFRSHTMCPVRWFFVLLYLASCVYCLLFSSTVTPTIVQLVHSSVLYLCQDV